MPAWYGLLPDAVADVRAVETDDELLRVLQAEARDDLLPRAHVGGGGERDPRHAGEFPLQDVEREVVGAEVVAPLRNTMRFVDGEEGDLCLVQEFQRARLQQALRRDVQEVDAAFAQRTLGREDLLRGQRGVQEASANAEFTQRAHLILHQRNQWRDHDARALACQRRHLVAQ